MSTNEASSNLYKQNKCDSSVSVYSNCELLMKQIHNVLEELESAKLIIKLLQKERDEDFPHGDKIDEAINSGRDTSAVVYSNRLENNTWTVTTAKCHRKGFSFKNLRKSNNTYPLSTANRYEQLTNLQDTQANDVILKTQGEKTTSDIPNLDYHTKLHLQNGERIQWIDMKNKEDSLIYHIPTLLNGKTGNKRV